MHSRPAVVRRVIMPKTLFDGKTKKQKIEEAKKLLVDNGYIVKEPLINKSDVSTPARLVRFFYDRLGYYNEDLKYLPSADSKRDMAIAKGFIESRMSSGASYQRAIQECCNIIEVLLKYEELLGVDFRISSMRILGQEKLGWITDKAIDILNGMNQDVQRGIERSWFDKLYRHQEQSLDSRLVDKANQRLGIEDIDNAKDKED